MGSRFSAPVQTGSGAHPASYTVGTGSFPGVKRPERGVDHSPHLRQRIKEEYSCTSTLPLGFRVLFYGDLYLEIIYKYKDKVFFVHNAKAHRGVEVRLH